MLLQTALHFSKITLYLGLGLTWQKKLLKLYNFIIQRIEDVFMFSTNSDADKNVFSVKNANKLYVMKKQVVEV